jgi:FAD dependent oxidoreductase TIGR03364
MDLVVVGAGIVGLAHAADAVRRGLSVTVVERDDRPVGASIRNFGHGGVTLQSGPAAVYARAARSRWLELGAAAGFWVGETGAIVVARGVDERSVLEELAAERGDEVELLAPAAVRARLPLGAPDILGGAQLHLDVRVDPREAVPAIARWLESQPGVTFRWATTLTGVEPGAVHTSRGPIATDRSVVCVGHDVDRTFPDVAAAAGVRRCVLRMLRVGAPAGGHFQPAVLTGTSLLRYAATASLPAAQALRARLESSRPDLLDAGVNLMFTQRPDGDLTIGDTHTDARTPDPFDDEHLDDLLLRETAALLGVDRLAVRQRWRGVYASAPGDFLVASPCARSRVVSVTSGIGMTTALGLAPDVLDALLAED